MAEPTGTVVVSTDAEVVLEKVAVENVAVENVAVENLESVDTTDGAEGTAADGGCREDHVAGRRGPRGRARGGQGGRRRGGGGQARIHQDLRKEGQ